MTAKGARAHTRDFLDFSRIIIHPTTSHEGTTISHHLSALFTVRRKVCAYDTIGLSIFRIVGVIFFPLDATLDLFALI